MLFKEESILNNENHIQLHPTIKKVIYFDDSTCINKDIFFIKHRRYIIEVIKSVQKIKDEEQAEDIVQDLYIAMYEKFKFNSFETENNARRFCCGWCKLRLKEIMRKYRYETKLYNFVSPDYRSISYIIDENLNEISENDKLINEIKENFFVLTERQQEMLELQFIYGYSTNKISKKLNITEATVSKTITNAIKRIRKSFGLIKIKTTKETNRGKEKKIVNQYTLSGEFKATYYSVLEASNKTGIYSGSISNACLKKVDTAGGYLWEYIPKCLTKTIMS